VELGKQVIDARLSCYEVVKILGGKAIHPVCAIPGGMSKGLNEEELARVTEIATGAVEFSKLSIQIFNDVVLGNEEYLSIITSDAFRHETHYMGLVDENNNINFYDGLLRTVDPDGKEINKFHVSEYLDHIAEHVEPWSFLKFPFLKKIGWKGFEEGKDSGVYRVAPLGRVNAADGMATPLAQEEYERMYETLGGKPIHATLATHWARLVEMLYASERMVELVEDDEIGATDIHTIPTETPGEGIAVVEAPRGVLIHHYIADEEGMTKKVNLIVGTTHNYAPICMSIKRAAEGLITPGTEADEGILNMIEMAFRAYDPCLACATHCLPGQMPLDVEICDNDRRVVRTLSRGL